MEAKKESYSFWFKVKVFFHRLKPSKRKLVQLYCALLYNANIKGFVTGSIFKQSSKAICVPGMNCYSCPGAIGACPIGSLQNALQSADKSFPFYVIGIILLQGVLLGRTVCGWLCPFGLIQELLYKIHTPKLKKSKVTRALSYLKYIILVIFVIGLPLLYAFNLINNAPFFCKYICPVGTLEGALPLLSTNQDLLLPQLGFLFSWKFIVLVTCLVAAVFIYRFFCRFLCPLGALFGLFNKFSVLGVKVNESKCNHCGRCVRECKMDIKKVGDSECIGCGECKKSCITAAIEWKPLQQKILDKKDNKAFNIVKKAVPYVMLAGLIAVVIVVNVCY